MKQRLVLATAAILFLGINSVASAKVGRTLSDLSQGPRVIRYDPDKDEVLHQESIVSVASRHRPGGEHSYSGNRLEAFQFRGKPGRGGLYDALEDHKRLLDPRKYQYRHR
ncbi:MAG TPA: hypothetical protein VHC22_10910 [Pirellulales bacterium]|nr:hypothetical protein [Pirellulales bacterium]